MEPLSRRITMLKGWRTRRRSLSTMRSRRSSRRNWLSSTPSSGALRLIKPKRPDRQVRIEGHEIEHGSSRFGLGDLILTVTVHLFLLRCERLEARVLRCKPTLVTLRIDPSLAAFLGQYATDPLD